MIKGATYLVLTDSTGIQNAGAYRAYPNVIQQRIERDYGPIRVINKSLIGSKSVDAATQQNLRLIAAFSDLDLITIGFGMNDADTTKGVTVASYKANVQIIIDYVKYRNPNADIILTTPNQTTDATNRSTIQLYRDAMGELATLNGLKIALFETAWTTANNGANLSDSVHPNDAGHQKLADILYLQVQAGAGAVWLSKL